MVMSIFELNLLPFYSRSVEERIQIFLDGKPRPVVSFAQPSVSLEQFDVTVYDRVWWLTACDRTNSFYCWPCLLFMRPRVRPLFEVSSDLNPPPYILEEHEKHNMHKLSVSYMKMFEKEHAGKMNPKPPAKRYRHVYQKNQDILKILIGVVCEIAKSAPLLKVCETQNRINPDSCVAYLQLLQKCCGRSSKHAGEAIDWVKRHPKLLDDIVEAIKKVLEMRLKKEMESSTHVSLILSEHSTESSCSQLSLVARYIRNGKVQERLLGFLSILVSKTAEVICKILFAMLERFGLYAKFLSCSLDGAILDTYQLSEFKKMVSHRFPQFYFVPCYIHELYYILHQSLSACKNAGPFFKLVVDMGAFFDRKSQHWTACTSLLLRKVPVLRQSEDWQDVPLVALLCRYRLLFIEYLESVSKSCSVWSSTDVVSAHGFQQFLKEFQTVFLLHVVSAAFEKSPFTFLDKVVKSPNPELWFDQLSEVDMNLTIKTDFEDIWRGTLNEMDAWKQELYSLKKGQFKELFNDVVNRLYEEIRVRFFHLRKLEFCCLLQSDYYSLACQNVDPPKNDPELYFTQLQKHRENMIDVEQLKSEIQVLKDCGQMLEGKDLYSVLETVSDVKYRKIFVQFLKLLEFTLSLPFKRPSSDAGCLKLQKIKDLQIASMIPAGEISVLIIESDLVQNLRSDDVFFYRDVISHFNEANKYIELMDERV